VRERVELVLKIARAVHYAHQRGIIHRDLKPGNILMDDEGNPFVTDFGLARWTEQEATITIGEHLIGTPAYMAPEQVQGKQASVTVGSDVWSLGVLLWQLIEGRVPFEAETLPALIHSIVHEEAPPLFRAAPSKPASEALTSLRGRDGVLEVRGAGRRSARAGVGVVAGEVCILGRADSPCRSGTGDFDGRVAGRATRRHSHIPGSSAPGRTRPNVGGMASS